MSNSNLSSISDAMDKGGFWNFQNFFFPPVCDLRFVSTHKKLFIPFYHTRHRFGIPSFLFFRIQLDKGKDRSWRFSAIDYLKSKLLHFLVTSKSCRISQGYPRQLTICWIAQRRSERQTFFQAASRNNFRGIWMEQAGEGLWMELSQGYESRALED